MKITFDANNLLVIENPNIPQVKEYTYETSGYRFSSYDKGIIILHKKDFKIINLKDLGDNMNVVYFQEAKSSPMILDQEALQQALGMFNAFDETTGKTYFFIPNMPVKDIQEKNQTLEKLQIKSRLTKTDSGIVTDGLAFADTEKRISLLFGLLLIYGKFEGKPGELTAIKIHIPLFGQYMKHGDTLDRMVEIIKSHGIFLKTDKPSNNNGITYQISSNDYQLLEIFAKWYEPIEKFEKITKRDFAIEMKNKLIQFIETNPEIPAEGKAEVLKQIQNGIIKFLTK